MFILIVAGGYPTQKYPGIGIFEFDQARALAAAGHKVIYAAVDLRSIRRWRKWGVEHLTKDDVEIYAINIPLGRIPYIVLQRIGKSGLIILGRMIQKEHGEPDIIHAHFINVAEITLCLKKKFKNAIFIVTEHSSFIGAGIGEHFFKLKERIRNVYALYDKVITVSPFLAKKIYTIFSIDSIYIPNMLDPIFLLHFPYQMHYDFNFVFVGRLDKGKSPLECIHAFYDAFHNDDFVTSSGRRINLCIIGDGPLMLACRKLVKDIKIESNVQIMGFLTREKIVKIMYSSDCFVLPSQLETFGVAYIEAMACGLPVIATKCGGPESFINETTGVLIATNDHGALVNAMKYMLENQQKYNKAQIKLDACRNFSPYVIAEKLLILYEMLLKNNARKF